MPRGAPKLCTKCGRKHWSFDHEECPECRHVPESRRSAYKTPRFRVLDHDIAASPSTIKSGAGRCLGRSPQGLPSEAEKRCRTHWRRLSHRHCPTVGCGRAMAADAEQCGACTALELFEPQALALRAITHPEPKPELFPSIDHYSDRAHEEYLADMLGLPVTLAI